MLKAIALDVDGVLTDGGVWLGPGGAEWKCFSFVDIMGISLARRAGLTVIFISGEDSLLIDCIAAKMGVTEVVKGCKDKAAALRSFAERHQLALEEICFMGDDVNDLGAMEISGLAVAPADARPAVRSKANVVTEAKGGNGAVRELVDGVLSNTWSS